MDDDLRRKEMIKKKRRKSNCRAPSLDWNQFIVDWNQLYSAGANLKTASQFFGITRACLAARLGTLAKLGIYLPRLSGMRNFKNKKWKHVESRIRKKSPLRPAPKMLADMPAAGMLFRLMPVAAS